MNLPAMLNDACVTCADTGRWVGEPDPCPECGAFITRAREPKKSLRYITKHENPNRKERRADKSVNKKAAGV